jgi:PAS domain S-box-containing protein
MKIKQEKEFTDAILSHSRDGIAVITKDLRILLFSAGMAKLSGSDSMETDDLRKWLNLYLSDEENIELIKERITDGLKENGVYIKQLHIRDKNAKSKWCSLRISRMDENRYVLNLHEISDLILAEEALKESEAKFRQVVERSRDGIVMVQNSNIVYINPSMCNITGFSQESLLHSDYRQFVHPDYYDATIDNYNRRLGGCSDVPDRYESALIGLKDQKIPVEINASIIKTNSGLLDLVFVRDLRSEKLSKTLLSHHLDLKA